MRIATYRRVCWIFLLLLLSSSYAFSQETGRRPVLYNADSDSFYQHGPERMDRQYLEGIVRRLAEAKVTLYSQVFYDGGHCFYDTKVGVRFDRDPDYKHSPASGQFTDLLAWRMVANFQRLQSQGNEPLTVYIEASHARRMKFLACLRMNDRHEFNVKHPPLLVRQHAEFAMKRKDGTVIAGMDFQHPEVRDFVFRPMQEIAENYDVDGLELDWMRWVQMFSETVPKEERQTILSDYHRRIRKMLDAVGARKGKHLLLSVRIPQTLEACEAMGFDVATYVREGLIDILCPSDFIILDPHMRLEPFQRLTRGTKVLLLPSLHAPTGFKSGLPSAENIRAVAHSYYQQGADGLSVYNWFTPLEIHLPENYAALAEVSHPEGIARSAREYLFNPMWGMKSQTSRLINYKAVVARSAPGQRAVYPLFIKEDLSKVRAVLKLKIENLTLEDEIRLDINGTPVDVTRFKTSYNPEGDRADTRWLQSGWEAAPYYVYKLADAGNFLRDGPNEVGITLVRANPTVNLSIRLYEVRVTIHHK